METKRNPMADPMTERLVITLTHGDPITLTGAGMWEGLQRAIEAHATWATFHVQNGKVTIALDAIASALWTPPT
jgi:hypothetical protein